MPELCVCMCVCVCVRVCVRACVFYNEEARVCACKNGVGCDIYGMMMILKPKTTTKKKNKVIN